MATNYNTERFIQHLKDRWSGRGCPLCGTSDWQVQDSVFELRQFSGGGLQLGGSIIPLVPVICANCGNTVLVNALKAGVLDRPEDSAKAEEVKK